MDEQWTLERRYAANMQLLAQHQAEAIRQMPEQFANVPLTNVQLFPNAQGACVGALWDKDAQQWIGVCDTNDPQGQAERDVEAVYSPQVRVFTLLGLGLGHAAVALARRLRPYQRLSIWEMSPVLFRAMFYAVDAAPLFTDKRVHLFVGPHILTSIESYWLSLESSEKLCLGMPLRAGYTTQSDAQTYDTLLAKTADMLRHHMVGLSTWRMFGRLIMENDLENLPEYFVTPGYDRLAGLWHDRPAVCVAAGPSLQRNLRDLFAPEVRDRVALLTAGTVYAMIQSMGLRPDIVTTIDFQRLNWTDQFQYVPLDPDCPLVYLHSTYPQTVRRWPGPRFVAKNGSDTVAWFSRYAEEKGSAAQIQTVAHLTLLVALMLGANPICLIGQDLAMSATEHHAAGARAQDQAPCEVHPDAFLPMPGMTEDIVYTRHSFLSMKTVFEKIAADHPERTIWNCTEGGLALTGIPSVPLRTALASCGDHGTGTPRGTLRRMIADIARHYTPAIAPEVTQAVEGLRRDVSSLVDEICPAVDRWAAQWQRWDNRDPEQDLAHDGLAEQAMDALVALDAALQQRQPAFGLFILRDFRLVELLSAIPQGDAWLTDPRVGRRLACERLIATVAILRDNAAEVQDLVRRTMARVTPILDESAGRYGSSPVRYVRRAFAQQHYQSAAKMLQEHKLWDGLSEIDWSVRDWLRLWAHYLLHTQQYDALIALESLEIAPVHCARARRRKCAYLDETRAIVPAYFVPVQPSKPPGLASESPCGAAIGA